MRRPKNLKKNPTYFWNCLLSKGQWISECLLGVIDFPKNQQKIWQISALESKKWTNQQSTLDSGISVAPWINIAPGTFG